LKKKTQDKQENSDIYELLNILECFLVNIVHILEQQKDENIVIFMFIKGRS